MTPAENITAAKRHLRMLVDSADAEHRQIELRVRSADGAMRSIWFDDARTAAAAAVDQSAKADVFVGVACRREKGKGGAAGIDTVGLVWADLDGPEAVDALGGFDVAPSLLVESSPGHAHAYWRLTSAIPAVDAEALNRRLATRLGADPKCADRARILRVAGTVHRKDPLNTHAVMARDQEGPPVSAQAVRDALPTDASVALTLWNAPSRAPRPTTSHVDSVHDALRAIPAEEYVPRLTGREVGSTGFVQCPWHNGGQERTPSLNVRGGGGLLWRCHGACDEGGDIYKLAGRLWGLETRDDFPELKARLAAEWGLSVGPLVHGNGMPTRTEPRASRVQARKLADYTPTVTSWLWKDRIPCGELSLLAGDGGLGKSTFAAYLSGLVTRGEVRGSNGTREVVIVLGEDAPDRVLAPRFIAAGADMARVTVVSIATEEGDEDVPIFPDDFAEIRATIDQLQPDLIVVDPLTAHLSGSTDSHRDGGKGGIRGVLGPLSRLARASGAAVLVVMHLNKGNGDPSQRLSGSAGIRNAARNVLMFVEHPDARLDGEDDGRRIIGHNKCNYGQLQPSLAAHIQSVEAVDPSGRPLHTRDGGAVTTPILRVGETSDLDYAEAMRSAGPADDQDRSAVSAAGQFVRDELSAGPVPTQELKQSATAAGHAWRAVQRAFAELGVKSAKSGMTWVRYLPGHDDGGVDDADESPAFMGVRASTGAGASSTPPTQVRVGGVGGLESCGCGWRALPAPDGADVRCTRCRGLTSFGAHS